MVNEGSPGFGRFMPASPALAGISVSGLPGFYIGLRVSAAFADKVRLNGDALVIFPDNPEVMTHFARCTEVTSNLTTPSLKCLTRFAVSGRASPVAGRAAQPTD